MKIRALGNSILFQFLDGATRDGMFATKLSEKIVVMRDDMDKQGGPRWGKVVAVGPDVGKEIEVGKFILIDSLKWTTSVNIDKDNKIWKTTYEHISAISDTEVTFF